MTYYSLTKEGLKPITAEGRNNLPRGTVLQLLREQQEAAKAIATKEREQHLARGRELFAKLIPPQAKALVVAESHEDRSDTMTDYFSHRVVERVVLGWSKHTRDLFPEMRKFADRIPETAHLKTPPEVNESGNPKTDQNKSWWHPKDEHREKYSMGHGYYLKDGWTNATGWAITKVRKWGEDWPDDLYIALSKRHEHFTKEPSHENH